MAGLPCPSAPWQLLHLASKTALPAAASAAQAPVEQRARIVNMIVSPITVFNAVLLVAEIWVIQPSFSLQIDIRALWSPFYRVGPKACLTAKQYHPPVSLVLPAVYSS